MTARSPEKSGDGAATPTTEAAKDALVAKRKALAEAYKAAVKRSFWGRWLPRALIAYAIAALSLALYAQYAQDLAPCKLCIYQRLPYALIIVLSVVSLRAKTPGGPTHLARTASILFLIGAGIATYHVGVEQHWWTSGVCGQAAETVGSPADLLAGLSAPAEKPCDAIDWTFFGVSMATYNAILSAILAVILWRIAGRIPADPSKTLKTSGRRLET